jgi:hypothetical protein
LLNLEVSENSILMGRMATMPSGVWPNSLGFFADGQNVPACSGIYGKKRIAWQSRPREKAVACRLLSSKFPLPASANARPPRPHVRRHLIPATDPA